MALRAVVEDRPPVVRPGLRPGLWRFAALVAIAANLIGLVLCFATWDGRRTIAGTTLGGDYPAFYVAGQMVNDGQAGRLYDTSLQSERYHRLMPGESLEVNLPFANPPGVALLFAPLSRLPYEWSYLLWTCITLLLYGGGVAMALAGCRNLPRGTKFTLWLVAMAFEPFIVETLHGGQLSAIAVAVLGLCLWLDQRGRPVLCGAALGLLLYKPTLLPLLLLMLVATNRWRVLAGFAMSGLALAGVTLAVMGRAACAGYVSMMRQYAANTGGTTFFRTFKFVDLNSAAKLAMSRPVPAAVILTVLGVSALWLALRWRRAQDPRQAWASAILLTPVLGVYCGIYDAAIAAVGGVMALDARYGSGGEKSQRLWVLLAMVFVAGWVTQPVALHGHVQLLTIALAVMGVWTTSVPLSSRQRIARRS